MTPLFFSQSLSPLSLPLKNPNPKPRKTLAPANSSQSERGVDFDAGDSFFRRESSVARDLGVLSASIHRNKTLKTLDNPSPSLRVLDAMCGCGVRSLRYLLQSDADFVHANDACEGNRSVIVGNLSRVSRVKNSGERRWIVTHNDANRLMVESYLNREYFDIVDVDSFGSDSSFLRSAIMVVRDGGLLYLTSTDGFSSGGHRPQHPYGFICYCHKCGNSQAISWGGLGKICCPCSNGTIPQSLVVSGPLWTGPLHDASFVTEMLNLAGEWSWAHTKETGVDLEKLLRHMIDESNPQLPFGFIRLDEIASRAKINSPPMSMIIDSLQKA